MYAFKVIQLLKWRAGGNVVVVFFFKLFPLPYPTLFSQLPRGIDSISKCLSNPSISLHHHCFHQIPGHHHLLARIPIPLIWPSMIWPLHPPVHPSLLSLIHYILSTAALDFFQFFKCTITFSHLCNTILIVRSILPYFLPSPTSFCSLQASAWVVMV